MFFRFEVLLPDNVSLKQHHNIFHYINKYKNNEIIKNIIDIFRYDPPGEISGFPLKSTPVIITPP